MGATRESPSLDDAADDSAELDELRRRAYGPAADIFDDSSALARLIELELRHGAGRAGPVPKTPDTRDEGPDAPAAEDGAAARSPDPRPRRRSVALVATAAGAALIAAGVISA